ncbi:hypothetical protein JAAARDRAFT_31543 [Jaapia argillacea MUCL 33604]|uniref:RRM domain-containing protein n=1 Tax=Jaapia argillacea MUCL 33604 TaxID=933084 RepID=A0A067QD97_9AGAM|nr:hypothetical protein JAAARDRAFT_31543 [Jaapia argillacea MUCL 33604]
MTSSPSIPDISSLSLSSSSPRLHDSYDYEGNGNGGNRAQYFSTSPAIQAQSQYNPLGMSQSPLKNKPLRAGLPTQWLDNSASLTDSRSLSPHNNSDLSSSGGSPPPIPQLSNLGPGTPGPIGDDDIIPNAIVIKNIPFNVKRETLLDIIASLSIPTPYAFNYHLDPSGQFRGLAFANFRQAGDADAVVAALNGFDVQGRKLRVEYKKVLQAGEKERIEREKAIRRMKSMQLEKEHHQVTAVAQPQTPYDEFGAIIAPTFAASRSFSGGYPQHQAYSPPQMPPMPVAQHYGNVSPPPMPPMPTTASSVSIKSPTANELDMNDPATLEIYSRILLFKDDLMRDELAFSRALTPKQRRIVHLVAQKLGVYHYSVGEGEDRYAVVTRIDPAARQQTARHTLSRAPSAYLSPTSQQPSASSLRAKKSMPDMNALRSQAPRLNTRASNGNMREGYATIASPSRRSPGGFGALFGNQGGFGGGSSIPPVPSLPASVSGAVNGSDGPSSGVVRQPRGPGTGGFGTRRDRVIASESQVRGGFEARSHEPLEI